MILWLASIPIWQSAALIAGVPTIATMILTVLIRRNVGFERLVSHNEVAGFKFAVVGVVYAVLLGFAVITVWEKFKDAQDQVTSEAAAAAAIYRLADGIDKPYQPALKTAVSHYLAMVLAREARTMEIGAPDVSTNAALDRLYSATLAAQPSSVEDSDVFQGILGELQLLSDARRERLELSRGAVPPIMWSVLIFGAILNIAFAFFFGTRYIASQVAMTGILAAVIFISLFVIINLNFPFTGGLKVSMDPLEYTLAIMSSQP
jgi:Protein of unknown function (DUF4239)